MAFFDQGQVVVRVVYDGPALAGKTSSLTALGRSLGREVSSGGEAGGRTLFFDWMDYVGGLFEGHPIRCQVVAVPGQERFWPRRRVLLESADVVVFVADSDANRLGADLRALDKLTSLLSTLEPAPAVILQANKRDLKTAVPLFEIRKRLAVGELVAVTESIASEGVGIRETFVLAVRLALDRVRELRRLGELPDGPPEVDNADELLQQLQALAPAEPVSEPAPGQPVPGQPVPGQPVPGLRPPSADVPEPGGDDGSRREERAEPEAAAEAAVEPSAAGGSAVPRPPTPLVPGGMIWPPTDGRIILHESQPDLARVDQLASGGWADFGNPLWLIHSPKGYSFAKLDDGRAELIAWARWHVDLGEKLSPRRCVVLGEVGQGVWRLWQIVGRKESFRELLEGAFATFSPERIGRLLLTATDALVEVWQDPKTVRLRPTIDSLGLEGERPVFVGLLPPAPGERGNGGPPTGEHAEATESGLPSALAEVNSLLADGLGSWPGGPLPLLDWMDRNMPRSPVLRETWQVIDDLRGGTAG